MRLNLRLSNFVSSFQDPESNCDRHFLIQLEPSGVGHLPSLSSGQEGAQQAAYCWGHHTYLDSSLLVPEGMVSRPHTVDSRHTPTPPTSHGFTTSTTRPQVLSGSPRTSTKHVETIKRLLHHRGHSSRVVRFLAKAKWLHYYELPVQVEKVQGMVQESATPFQTHQPKVYRLFSFPTTGLQLSTSAIKGS